MPYNYINPWVPQYQQPAVPNLLYQQASQPPQQPQQNPPCGGFDWVQGEVGARAYKVQPGKMAFLVDSEDNIFYIKFVDQYGMPQPLRKFRFTEIVDEQPKQLPQFDASQYLTKDEFEKILTQKLDEMTK